MTVTEKLEALQHLHDQLNQTRNEPAMISITAELEEQLHQLQNETFVNCSSWDKVQLARHPKRPNAMTYIQAMFTDFIELHGDRQSKDDPSMITGLAFFMGRPVTIVAQAKGRDMQENILRNFGMNGPEGYRKSLRIMKQAEKFNRPIITFIDTPGAYPGITAEEKGQGEAIARNLLEMSTLQVPIIAIVIGEGGSGGALALSVCDRIYMLEHAVYSILSPEGFATILWKDSKRAQEAAELMKMTAQDLKELGFADTVVPEPIEGIQFNPYALISLLSSQLQKDLTILDKLRKERLVALRYQRYRKFGETSEKQRWFLTKENSR